VVHPTGAGVNDFRITLVGLLVIACLACYLVRQIVRRRVFEPRSLFHALCKVHGLSKRDRRILERLAECHGIREQANLFLQPERFEPERLPIELRGEQEQVAGLKSRLFSSAAAAVGEAKAASA
jgi:hypothetical protein